MAAERGTDSRGTGERSVRPNGTDTRPPVGSGSNGVSRGDDAVRSEEPDGLDDAPEAFRTAVRELRAVVLRPEVELTEIAAPRRLAPYAVAFTADVTPGGATGAHEHEEIADGRLVVLYDPDAPEAWRGTFRFVSLVRAEVEPEMAADPPVADVGWSWLLDALAAHGASFVEPGGTVTLCSSRSFGALAARAATTEIEIRASWTPLDEPGSDGFAGHLEAWAELLCLAAGIPPEQPGVTMMQPRRDRG